jgi:hypothetical protein
MGFFGQFKMAELGTSTVCSPAITNSLICHKKSVMCHLCDELSTELHKAQQEILSYEKVIQVLHEELNNMDQRARPDASSWSELPVDYCRSSRPKDGWHQVPVT